MKFFKFIKNYLNLKKVIYELEYKKAVAEINIKNLEKSLEHYYGTFATYRRKRLEFFKGKVEGYQNSIDILKCFINTGKLLNIEESKQEKEEEQINYEK